MPGVGLAKAASRSDFCHVSPMRGATLLVSASGVMPLAARFADTSSAPEVRKEYPVVRLVVASRLPFEVTKRESAESISAADSTSRPMASWGV